jgi:3-hydroxyacyl-[acyl-carrier-protein] dehydratase
MLYNKEDIKRIIPHREPMLLLDEILEVNVLEDGNIIVKGKKTFTGEEDFFKGHFPNLPVVPGVLVL